MTAPSRYVPEIACRLALSEAADLLARLEQLSLRLCERHPALASTLSGTARSLRPTVCAALQGKR